jgi:hypothetical protein
MPVNFLKDWPQMIFHLGLRSNELNQGSLTEGEGSTVDLLVLSLNQLFLH